jgi:predicted transcriptional regulator
MLDTDFKPKIEEENFIDEAILGALGECRFSSVRQIAKRILISVTTVRYYLVNSLRYRIRNIRWVPRSLSSNQKQAGVEMSQDLI